MPLTPHPVRRRAGLAATIAGLLLALIPAAGALGAAGAVDATFSPGGWTPLGTVDQVEAVAAQPDGRIIVGYAGAGGAWVARVTADGVADPFWTEAVMTGTHIRDIAVQADGMIIVVGDFTQVNGVTHYGVARLRADGTLDSTYAPAPNAAIVRAVALQSDGKAIITGWFTQVDGLVRSTIARLNTDGTLDTSFGAGGAAIQSSGFALGAAALAVQGDGKILIGGDFDTARATSVNALARLNADGSLDNTFAASAPSGADVQAMTIDGSGRLLVGGTFATMAGRGTVNIARLGADGAGDASWALGGPNGPVLALGIDVNGRIIAGGSFTQVNGVNAAHLARFTGDGAHDTSFTAAATVNNPVVALTPEPTANVVIGGAFSAIPKLARISGGATAPGVPTGVTVSAGDGSATISWTAPVDTGGIPLTGYTVTGIPGGSCTTTGTSCTITGLVNGTGYTFLVRATNALTSSADSGPSAPVVPSSTSPSAGGGATPTAGAGTVVAKLATSWAVKRARVTATITPARGATVYTLRATRKGAAARNGSCVARTVRRIPRRVCTITLTKGTWTLTAEARAGAMGVAQAVRIVKVR